MHITLATVGSRGDVQPYIALGIGLKTAGHSVCLATHRAFETLIRQHGLDFSPMEGNPREMVESDAGQDWLATGANTLAFVKQMSKLLRPMMVRGTRDCLDACKHADLVLYSILGWLAAHNVVEKLGIPGYAALLQPIDPTKHFPSFAFPVRAKLGSLGNRLTYAVGEQTFWMMFRKSMNAARRDVLQLPPLPLVSPARELRKRRIPVLYGYSPTVLAKPPDWPPSAHVTGYWFLGQSSGWEPPANLVEFLESGSPPVYVGFGSMHARNAEDLTTTVTEALSRAGLRGVVQTGWGALTDNGLPNHVFPIESIPHEWLFPRVAAVVHHGGAGTTAVGLRVGVPSIVVPFFGDQFFWGGRVADLKVGPKPVPVKKLTVDRLVAALNTVATDQEMRERASAVGELIRNEDGVAKAVEVVGR